VSGFLVHQEFPEEMMVFKDFVEVGVPLEIGERADESVPFVKRASLNALLQWKLGLSKIQMFSASERLYSRLFWRKKCSAQRFH